MFEILPIAVLGLTAGILVNYLADILPIKRYPGTPVCLYCGKEQKPVPYLVWPRRCPHCDRPRGLRTWLVEIIYVGLFIWLWTTPSATMFLPFWAGAILWVFFGVVAVIDLELRLILHPVSIAGAILGAGIGFWLHGFGVALIGGLVGYGIMFALYGLGTVFTRITRHRQGSQEEVALGFGDVNLAGVLGLMVGWPNVLPWLIIAVLLGGFFSLLYLAGMLLLRRYNAFTAIPYGPFLIGGAALLLFFPETAQQLLGYIGPLFWLSP